MSEYALRQRQLRNAAQTVQKLQSEEDAQDFYYCPDCTSGRSDYPPKGCGVCRDGTKLAFIRAGATLAEVERAFGVDVVSERNEDTSPSPSSIPATAGRTLDDTQTACDDGTCGLCRTCAPAGLPTPPIERTWVCEAHGATRSVKPCCERVAGHYVEGVGLPTPDEMVDAYTAAFRDWLECDELYDDERELRTRRDVARDALESALRAARLAVEAQQERAELERLRSVARVAHDSDPDKKESLVWDIYESLRDGGGAVRAERPTGGTE